MSKEYTDSGMEYELDLAGPGGMSFSLRPITGVHTKEDVQEAKWELYRDPDVAGAIGVQWQPLWEQARKEYLNAMNALHNLMENEEDSRREHNSKAEDLEDEIETLKQQIDFDEEDLRTTKLYLKGLEEELAELKAKKL